MSGSGYRGADIPSSWVPVVEERQDSVSPAAVAALHGLLDGEGRPPHLDDALPPLWHWLAFLPDAAQADLGSDGHPRTGGFLPPVRLPRRMFAGGRITFGGSAAVGRSLQRRSKVTEITEKSGRSGHLMFVEVTHTLTTSPGSVAITEVQDLVYRGSGESSAPSPPPRPGGDPMWPWRLDLATDPTVLFRFSALTYNAHRIHYDRDYATDIEGYPGLVVHGPLLAICLAELCRRFVPDLRLATFTFRARRPAFDGAPMHFRGRASGATSAELVALDDDYQPTMTAEATFVSG